MRKPDPYQLLGVSYTASLDEIETTYRQQIREHHPDLHQSAGAEAVADAEQRTRTLNEAMAQIRLEAQGAASIPPGAWRAGLGMHPTAAGAGPQPAICPYCQESFALMKDFSTHLDAVHALRSRQFGGSRAATGPAADAMNRVAKVRFIPAWLVAATFFFAFFTAFRQPIIWMPIMLLLLVVVWTQGSSSFKRRR